MCNYYVKELSPRSLTRKQCRHIFLNNATIRGMCLGWYDGSVSELITQSSMLQRLVVRAIAEIIGNSNATSSYGGTSSC